MDESELIAGLKGRDARAAEELVDSYGNRLLRAAFALCGNETEAQDLVQETFLQAIRSVDRFQGRSAVYTWLHSILINLTRHYHRDRKRIVYDDDAASREISEPGENPSELDAMAASSALWRALRRLSAAHREVIVLRYYENLKIHEIAAQLRISKGTVKSRLHYAIAEMENLLPREMNLFSGGGTEEMKKQ
jgi:RNA polymerase sigma-70 factor (ECF subfamily)